MYKYLYMPYFIVLFNFLFLLLMYGLHHCPLGAELPFPWSLAKHWSFWPVPDIVSFWHVWTCLTDPMCLCATWLVQMYGVVWVFSTTVSDLCHGVLRCALVSPFVLTVPGIVASSALSSVWSRLTQRYTAGESKKLRLNGEKASFLDDTSGIPLPCLPSSPLFFSLYCYNSGCLSSDWQIMSALLQHTCDHLGNVARIPPLRGVDRLYVKFSNNSFEYSCTTF